MVYKRVILALVLVVGLCAPLPAFSADVDDLKATVDQLFTGLSNRDADAVAATWHDETVFLSPSSPFPVVGKAARLQGLKAFLGSVESLTFRPMDTQFRVTGDTGTVWGNLMIVQKPKDGPMATRFVRYSISYTKVGEKWLSVATHAAPITVGSN